MGACPRISWVPVPAFLELKALGYDDVFWFNPMPTGYGHGKLIDDVRQVRETAFGRYLRRLNEAVVAPEREPPVQFSIDRRAEDLSFRIAFPATVHGFTGGS